MVVDELGELVDVLFQDLEVELVQYAQILYGIVLRPPFLIAARICHLQCFRNELVHIYVFILHGIRQLVE